MHGVYVCCVGMCPQLMFADLAACRWIYLTVHHGVMNTQCSETNTAQSMHDTLAVGV